ncbi:MAG TPA: lysophospholipid acyltransferase family protein [Anaerolineae bacterium]|nr:lysophospholipid acyltransferase family protein [Anaerolineae bacterium]
MTELPDIHCQAIAADGSPCANLAQAGSGFCLLHSDQREADIDLAGDGWLAIDDRAAAQPAQSGLAALPVTPLRSVGSAEPAESGDDLWIDDRLTEQRVREAGRQSRLQGELARFARAAQRLAPPGAEAMAPTAQEAQRLLSQLLGPLYPRQLIDQGGVWLSPDLWKGAWYVAAYLLRAQTSSLRRRLEGDYEIDDFGRDEAFLSVVLSLAQFLYQSYWRVEVSGIEHVPAQGRGMLVSNHSGVLPFDGLMLALALYNETTSQRLPRALADSWFPTVPFVSTLLQKTGQVQAHPLNALRLLERDELVAVFPEGTRGIGKPFRERYQLQRFGRGGFIKVALQAGAPIIPVAVVGAEEIYPVIGKVEPLARLLGLPFFPLTPTWPWTGPLGLAPLPTKWFIDIGQPIHLDGHDARAAANPSVVARLTDQVRTTIQRMLLERLARRRSVFLG